MKNPTILSPKESNCVICPLCGAAFPGHLKRHMKGYWTGHAFSEQQFQEYVKTHPEIKMVSDKWHENHSKSMIKVWKNPKWRDKTEAGKLNYRTENPKAHENYSKAGKIGGAIGGKRTAELHPNHWQIGINYLNDNSPFSYMGVGWHCSPIQRDITRLLFEKLGIISIKGLNCQLYYPGGEHDFKLLGCIYEPHVLYTHGSKETRQQYYARKRSDMDGNGHKDAELIVTTTYKEAQKLINWLSNKLDLLSPDIKNELETWYLKQGA